MGYVWEFGVVFNQLDLLLAGLLNTLKITGGALLFGIPLGLLAAILRLSTYKWLRVSVGVQLFWFFFALPMLSGIEMDPFRASLVTFSIQSSAFFAEVFRGGIISIERGQWEAARAIGMSYLESMRRIILPQAVKRMIPAFLERVIELMKTTTLVATVSYADLLYQANNIAQSTYRPLEVFTVVAGLYFIVLFPTSLLVKHIERQLAKTGEGTVH